MAGTLSNFYTHPRDYLVLELERRRSRNPAYSLRAFARDLGIAVSTLSEVIQGRYGMSPKMVSAIAQELRLDDAHRDHLLALFERQFAKKRSVRRQAARAVGLRRNREYRSLPLDAFRSIADWHHIALLEWMALEGGEVKDGAATFKRAARYFGIEAGTVMAAFDRLERIGRVERRDGCLRCVDAFTATLNDVPSEAIRSFHRQILEKASRSLEAQSVDRREISSTVLSIPKSRLKEAKRALRDFRKEFAERFGSIEAPDEVYVLGLQFFGLRDGKNDEE